jgi:hypothetical protein
VEEESRRSTGGSSKLIDSFTAAERKNRETSPFLASDAPSRGSRNEKARSTLRASTYLFRLPRYSPAASTPLVWATVQSAAPTLKRANRRTVMFSPSLPTFCAMSSLIEMAWSLMKGCSSKQTSS